MLPSAFARTQALPRQPKLPRPILVAAGVVGGLVLIFAAVAFTMGVTPAVQPAVQPVAVAVTLQ